MTSKKFYYVVPPPSFTHIEEKLSCCVVPFSKHNAFYCSAIGIQRILNYSGKPLDTPVHNYCTEKGIYVQNIKFLGEHYPIRDMRAFQSWIASNVEDILLNVCHASVIVIGSAENNIGWLLMACLRRTEHW